MVHKLALYVCPQITCPKFAGKPGKVCPTHGKALVRRIYVEDSSLSGLADSKGSMGDILSNLFGGKVGGKG